MKTLRYLAVKENKMKKATTILITAVVLSLSGRVLAALPGPIAHWEFDEGSGSVAYDSAGDNDGDVYGADWADGIVGGALDFDGVNDYVALSGLAVTTTEFTICGWASHVGSSENLIFQQMDDDAMESVIILSSESGRSAMAVTSISTGGEWQTLTYPKMEYGQWHHYAMTVGPDDFVFYIDGAEVAKTTNEQTGDYVTSVDYVYIGRHRVSGLDAGFFNGLIDDVRTYDVALSAGEVLGIYEERPGETYHVDGVNGNDGWDGLSAETAFATIQKGIDTAENRDTVLVWPGVYVERIFFYGKAITLKSADYPAVIEAPWQDAVSFIAGEGPGSVLSNFVIRESATAIACNNESSPTLKNLTIVDNDFGIAAYENSDPNITNCILWNNWSGDLFQCDARYSLVESEMDSDVTDGLVSHWKFDDGAGPVAYDSVGNNDGTIYGATWTNGILSGALAFDSEEEDYVDCGDDPSLFGMSAITLSAWVKPESTGTTGRIIASYQGRSPTYALYMDSGEENAGFNLYLEGGSAFAYETDNELTFGAWHHVVGTYDGSEMTIYLDGTARAIESVALGTVNSAGDPVSIGGRGYYFDGLIDDARIYDKALSAEEVGRLYARELEGGPGFADPANGDYHLVSEKGRYVPAYGLWSFDDFTGIGVDGGDPSDDPMGERMPNGGRINIGAYGGTAYASMSEWPFPYDGNRDGRMDFKDLAGLCDEWLLELPWVGGGSEPPEDTTPPTGLAWVIEPNAVSFDTVVMIASAKDISGVEYLFRNTTLAYDSGWRDEPNWVDTGLDPNTGYCYALEARDKSPAQNFVALPGEACVVTFVPPDTTPPDPAPTWDPSDPNQWPAEIYIGPIPPTDYGYTMTCTVAADPSPPVQYWFQCHEEAGINSGWIAVNTWTTPGFTTYNQNHGFWVKARDAYGNETAESEVKRPSDAFP